MTTPGAGLPSTASTKTTVQTGGAALGSGKLCTSMLTLLPSVTRSRNSLDDARTAGSLLRMASIAARRRMHIDTLECVGRPYALQVSSSARAPSTAGALRENKCSPIPGNRPSGFPDWPLTNALGLGCSLVYTVRDTFFFLGFATTRTPAMDFDALLFSVLVFGMVILHSRSTAKQWSLNSPVCAAVLYRASHDGHALRTLGPHRMLSTVRGKSPYLPVRTRRSAAARMRTFSNVDISASLVRVDGASHCRQAAALSIQRTPAGLPTKAAVPFY